MDSNLDANLGSQSDEVDVDVDVDEEEEEEEDDVYSSNHNHLEKDNRALASKNENTLLIYFTYYHILQIQFYCAYT